MSFAILSGPADPQPVSGTQGMSAYGEQKDVTTCEFILEGEPDSNALEEPDGSGGFESL